MPETIAASAGHAISQLKRKLIEWGFGWAKTMALRSGRYSDVARAGQRSCDRGNDCLARHESGFCRMGLGALWRFCRSWSVYGAPRYLRSDNGPEFVSRAILKWAADNGMDMALSDPGKPWQNGVDGELQRHVPRRMPEPGMVQNTPGSEGCDRAVATPLPLHPVTSSALTPCRPTPISSRISRSLPVTRVHVRLLRMLWLKSRTWRTCGTIIEHSSTPV